MTPLAEALKAEQIYFSIVWQRLAGRSWTLGHKVRRWGQRYYGSQWNGLLPIWGEYRIKSALKRKSPGILHFLWGEFASPSFAEPYRRLKQTLIGTFHCSARRQPEVLGGYGSLKAFDWITLMSDTQRPFFEEQGVPPERIRVILHGVDSTCFNPGPDMERSGDRPLRGLLVGKTERDHVFMSRVLQCLPPGTMNLRVATIDEQKSNYKPSPNLTLLPRLSDAELLDEYREADLLVMPMDDCTANNAVLESMACGTPVLANRIGGIPEYVSDTCNFLLDGKDVDEWVAQIQSLAQNRETVHEKRPLVRVWAESFDWFEVAKAYRQLYVDAWQVSGDKM